MGRCCMCRIVSITILLQQLGKLLVTKAISGLHPRLCLPLLMELGNFVSCIQASNLATLKARSVGLDFCRRFETPKPVAGHQHQKKFHNITNALMQRKLVNYRCCKTIGVL